MANAEATGWGLGRGWGHGEEAAFASDWRLDWEPEAERRPQPASGTGGEAVGLGGEDEGGRKGEERWRRNSRRKGETSRERPS